MSARRKSPELEEIGQFTTPWKRAYHPGQFFLHSKLGYRGIVVCTWSPDVIEYVDQSSTSVQGDSDNMADGEVTSAPNVEGEQAAEVGHTDPGDERYAGLISVVDGLQSSMQSVEKPPVSMTREQLYYQVLIDERDMSDQQRSVSAVIPNVGHDPHEFPVVCSAFDYVDHRHMLPYNPSAAALAMSLPEHSTTVGQQPADGRDQQKHLKSSSFDNALFNELFQTVAFHNPSYSVTGSLAIPKSPMTRWNDAAAAKLKYSSIYRTTTNGVTVTVIPFLLNKDDSSAASQDIVATTGADRTQRRYHWAYSVMIENTTDRKILLVSRTWHTIDGSCDAHAASPRPLRGVEVDDVTGADTATDNKSTTENAEDDSIEARHLVDSGRGVVGQFPTLCPEQPIFLYSSTASLRCASGCSWGSFTFVEIEDETDRRTGSFQVNVPKFIFNANICATEEHIPAFSTGVPTKR